MKLLEDKVCVITGGCGSVGLASAALFLEHGAKVILVDVDADKLAAAQAELGSEHVVTCVGDVSNRADVLGYLEQAAARWGVVDVLFSNAGNHGFIGDLADYDEEAFDRTYQVHVKGAFLACKHGPAFMSNGGSIIVTSSMAGTRGGAGAGQNIAYVTAKHAQTGVVRAAARALAPRRIRVNSLNPGPIDNLFQQSIEDQIGTLTGQNVTAMIDADIPLGRHADPVEIANAALYLASDMSSFVTGHIHAVDGGLAS
ncbi:SDR family NAD(P)-dependent oxidoreductase [Rhizobium leguminosarum]|uniref:SDR family NAD(P)-dependent oxidoreductase n=1 Tax=Rhizobium leguminosarum TaxID=384 RepID=UPI001C90D5E6|nr:SDR family oxidoreductase [Rhizobium leguminosarum]MBY3002049.1 SDR family oxidoreductase [Rhizobium leguminosarum]